jgi:hypothetical protein
MQMRRPPHILPGRDALWLHKLLLGVYLVVGPVILALAMDTAAEIGAQVGDVGHLPWPILQWTVATPQGTLVAALVGGLISGLPFAFASRDGSRFAYAVDVTELPLSAWPTHPLPPWRRPGGPTRAEYWLGRRGRQRILSLLALVLAILLMLSCFAALGAIWWYGITHFPDCAGSRCPPTYGNLGTPICILGLAILWVSQYIWTRHVERRCGIWFRVPDSALGGFTSYVRRPGVTAEAAASALARYTREAHRSVARSALVIVLILLPYLLVLVAVGLLVAWLPTQWTPV